MPGPSRSARNARWAVAALFFANGALFANVVPRYPDIIAGLDLSNAAFGAALGANGLAALIVGLSSGVLVTRFGSARVGPLSTMGLCLNLVLIGIAPSWLALAAVLAIAGSLDSIADVAGNVHGLRVERSYGRSVLNSLHGVWSIGAVCGGLIGVAAAGLATPLVAHLSLVAVLFAMVASIAWRFMLPGPDDGERAIEPRIAPGADGRWFGRLSLLRGVIALGVVAAMAQTMEDASAAWGTVYLREELGAAAAVAGLGFVALQTSQIVGRLVGDHVVTRYGDRAVGRVGAALAGIAMATALALPSTLTTIVAFGLVGLGIGTLIPAAMRSADAIPGLAPGVGLTLAGTVDRVAILIAPPVIGVMADASSLRIALVVIPLAALVVLLSARVLPATPMLRRQPPAVTTKSSTGLDPLGRRGPRP